MRGGMYAGVSRTGDVQRDLPESVRGATACGKAAEAEETGTQP